MNFWQDRQSLHFVGYCITTKGALSVANKHKNHVWTLSTIPRKQIMYTGDIPAWAVGDPSLPILVNSTYYIDAILNHPARQYPFKVNELKLIAKGMKCFDFRFKTSGLNKAKLKEAIEEQSKVTDDDGESYIRRSKSYIRKAFPRIPGKQIDEAEGKIESFIREEEERMNGEKNGQGKCDDEEMFRAGKEIVTSRYWIHDLESGELAVGFMRMVMSRMEALGTADNKVKEFSESFERLYVDKGERFKGDRGSGGDINAVDLEAGNGQGTKRKGENVKTGKRQNLSFSSRTSSLPITTTGVAAASQSGFSSYQSNPPQTYGYPPQALLPVSYQPMQAQQNFYPPNSLLLQQPPPSQPNGNGQSIEELSRNMAADIAARLVGSSNRNSSSVSDSLGGDRTVKNEPNGGVDALGSLLQKEPLSDREHAIVSRLMEMGFPKLESVQGCRAAAKRYHHGMYPSNCSIVVDEAMCIIVEEMEEKAMTVMMDKARVESERENDRREEERREKEKEERRKERMGGGDTVDQILKSYSSSSMILRSSCSSLLKESLSDPCRKASCIRILNLERNAQRWYGVNCRAYFLAKLPERVGKGGGGKAAWEEEVKILEKAMFSLSEAGGGGTPKIFEEARDESGEKLGTPGGTGEGDDDEIIIVNKPEEKILKNGDKMKEQIIIEID